MKRAIVVLSMILLAGCFEIEQSIEIKKDLSGTADFHLGVDLEPMVIVMAQVGREMEGKSGPVTAEELAKAKAEFKKKSTTSETKEPSREEIAKSLPEGVTLLDYAMKEREFGMATDFKFAFERLSALTGVKLPSNKSDDPTDANMIDTPFEGLEVSEEGNTLTIRTKPQNPTASVEEKTKDGPPMNPEVEKMMRGAFEKMRVVYRIKAPFEVISHNATRREGNTLVWEYDLATFEKMEKSGRIDDTQLRVTYRR
jgi:hypothetical protein